MTASAATASVSYSWNQWRTRWGVEWIDSMTDEEKRLYQEEQQRAEESAKLRDEDYQLAYAVDIIKGLTAIAGEQP